MKATPDATAMLTFPDLSTAPKTDPIYLKIATMLFSGELIEPDEFDNLPLGIAWCTELSRDIWCPPASRALLSAWVGKAAALLVGTRSTSAQTKGPDDPETNRGGG